MLEDYNVGAVDTLIGDITPPEALMKTLTDRKLAEQEQITYGTQKQAEEVRKDLAQARAMADTQPKVVDAERKVKIAEFDKQTAITAAEGEAAATITKGKAQAEVTTITGEADAKKTRAIGTAEADVIKMKTDAMD